MKHIEDFALEILGWSLANFMQPNITPKWRGLYWSLYRATGNIVEAIEKTEIKPVDADIDD